MSSVGVMSNQGFGKRLQELIDERGITKYRLGKESGVSENLIGKIVRGERNPTDEVIAKLAPVLGIAVSEMQAWADADRLGDDRLRAVQEHVVAPQMTVDEWIEAIRRLSPEEKAKARAELAAVLKELESQEGNA